MPHNVLYPSMSERLVPPRERRCDLCGRRDVWDDEAKNWRIDDEGAGRPHCVHEWDINGSYNPFDG